MARTILFAEVPGFYAAVERAEDPALSSRPVIVGGDPRKKGRVQAATPDALAAGITLEMPVIEALRLCPHARAVRTHMSRYREVSRALMVVMRGVLSRLEAFGMAGAYADVAGTDGGEAQARTLTESVQGRLGLPLRVGIASAKYLARLAAQELSESGIRRVPAGGEHGFLAPLPVTRLDGVGSKTAARLAELGVNTIGEAFALGRERLQEEFGAHGLRIYGYAAASDAEPVRVLQHPRSLSREATVRAESRDHAVLVEQLASLAQQLEIDLSRQRLAAGKVTLKLRFADQGTTTRTQTLLDPVRAAPALLEIGQGLLARTTAGAREVRGVGLQLTALVPADEGERQLGLFPRR